MLTYQLSLLVTERCNLRCSYCYCDKNMRRTMDFATARRAIEEAMSYSGDASLRVLLMGGEPFLPFKLIRDITKYIRTSYPKRNVKIKTITNGTLVHGDVQRWLVENKDIFTASLSLDGSRESHNRNRCNSYDNIDLGFFVRTFGKEAEASMVACPENLSELALNVISIEQLGFAVKCVLADDSHWVVERDVPLLASQLTALTDHYLKRPEQMPFTLLRKALQHVGRSMPDERCRPGVNGHCVTVDGLVCACHRCSPYYNNGSWKIVTEELSLAKDQKITEECNTCPAWSVCCACPALTASLNDKPDMAAATCAMFKTMLMANAAFVARLFLECPDHIYLRNRTDRDKRVLIEGAECVLNNISI